jgi:predicted nucleotidyltransferase
MFIETRRQGSKTKQYLVHTYRQGKAVKRIARYLGSDLGPKELVAIKEREAQRLAVLARAKNPSVINAVKKKILPILKKNGVLQAGIFGSFARGEQKKNSDIDLLVKLRANTSLFDMVGLKQAIEQKIHRKTDLLTYNSIHPLMREQILKEEVRIL